MTALRDRDDEKFMRLALHEAARGEGRTSPNPAVGAVIVRRGNILARGHHRRAGLPHAEIEALRDAVQSRRTTPAEIMHYARLNRVAKVMQPYLRALT